MIDRGRGVPVVLIPGLQGRWEWMSSTVDALAERCRVLTFSFADEPTSGFQFDNTAGFATYIAQLREVLARAGIDRAIVVGVSFGGLVATEFAIRHPDNVLGLVLTSALPPGWTPDARARFYMRAPRLLTPVFSVTSPARMFPELRAALGLKGSMRFLWSIARQSLRAAISPVRMARRVRWTESHAFADVSTLRMPVLLTTGEDGLDRVVAPALTRRYLDHLPQAKLVTLPCTGHIGLVTKPADFAEVISTFAHEVATADGNRRSA
jgi:pimeloyl-ACP methyl ester carboxylesterase